ncbi:MAG TPA: DinB family protein [Mycobacteriales bacterium]|nr:DinB family protein [Mycobacteriales bacterium]
MAETAFPSPTIPISDERQVLLGYLDFFREVALAKVAGMAPKDQTASPLASGWTPLELLNHLRHVERRWLEWGFCGVPMSDPWADHRDHRWHTDEDFAEISAQLERQAVVSRRVVEDHGLDEVGQPGERWDGDPPATLRRVLLHLVQEYARHCGHLDIVREMVDGAIGEDTGPLQ